MAKDQQDKFISLEQSYDVMVDFLERYYDIGLGQSEELRSLLSSLTRHQESGGYPFDNTLWEDYMDIAESKIAAGKLR